MTVSAKRLIVIGLVLVAAVSLYILNRPSPPPASESNALEQSEVQPSMQIHQSRLVGRVDGERQWEIESRAVQQIEDEVYIEDIEQVIIFRENEPYFFVEADRGLWHRSTNDLELEGDIIVTGPDDFYMETTKLKWHAADEILESPGAVAIVYEGADITANHMLAQTADDMVILKDNVRIIDGKQVWSMEHLVYSLDQELMEMYGSVVLQVEGETL